MTVKGSRKDKKPVIHDSKIYVRAVCFRGQSRRGGAAKLITSSN